jgi:hypothetical protein
MLKPNKSSQVLLADCQTLEAAEVLALTTNSRTVLHHPQRFAVFGALHLQPT